MYRPSKVKVTAVVPEPTLEEKLAAITKERDDLAAKYALLLQEKGGPTTHGEAILGPKDGDGASAPGRKDGSSDDATLGPKEASRTRRTRRQRLLDTIDSFSAQIISMIAELDREALNVAHECEVTRQELEAASGELKDAESRFAEELENVDAVVEEYASLRKERHTCEEQERSLAAELDGPRLSGTQSVVVGKRQRLVVRLKQAQANLKETESWMATTEGDYQKGCQQAELAAVEIEKLKRIVHGKQRELNDWLVPETEWFTKELENFRALHSSISTSLDAMRDGLEDGWEGKLGDNPVFLGGLGGYAIHPEIVAQPKNWAPVLESFYLSQVSLALSKEMSKLHSAVLQRLKIQEESAQREWKKGVEALFGQHAPSFKKSSLPQLIPLAEEPRTDVPEEALALSEEPGAGVPQGLSPPPPLLLEGHSNWVMSVVFSWDGSKIISGSADKTVRVWNASTGKVQSVLTGHSGVCTSVAISSDGSWIVSGSEDQTVRIWDAMTGTAHRVLVGHDDDVVAVAFSWDGSRICSGSNDKTVRVWDAATGLVQSILEGHTREITSVAFSRDGKRIVSGALDTTIRVWAASSTTCTLQSVLQGHSTGHAVWPGTSSWSVAFSMDGTRIVSGLADGTARVWDASTGSVLMNLEGHTAMVKSIAISPDGKKVVTGAYDRTVRVWDTLTGKLESVLEGHSDAVWSVAFSPDGRRVASGGHDHTIRVWDLSATASLSSV
ncbi:hypothetical protein D9611_007285 [Ephemerocybe angulata]|uniref:Vegetative incompatibility protein HET-E-1 n=1 Tax=Ephemerocybe angulata TaxID=980116 RepID=A0A8H5CHF9_9AGAR|nr:hypothetical protein D9611_007285 [Tulosesus angulatus]